MVTKENINFRRVYVTVDDFRVRTLSVSGQLRGQLERRGSDFVWAFLSFWAVFFLRTR